MTDSDSRRAARRVALCAALGLGAALAVPPTLAGQWLEGIEGDAWVAGGADVRVEPSEIDEITPWLEWRGTARNERFALNATLSFSDRALVRDMVRADQTPVTRVTGPGSDLAIDLWLRGDVQLLGRGTIASGSAAEHLFPREDGTVLGLFARGEGGVTWMRDDRTYWNYRVGVGFGAANHFHGGTAALWVGQTGRLDDRFDVPTPSRGGLTLEYVGPRVLWPRFFLRVDGSLPFHDRADVEDVQGLAGDLIDELQIMFGVAVPLIPRDL
ncbi:MAG: hypothetical protein R3195_13555 [Gemmatimonadota bacterium]|nr:hypothetical protein [Gemmatimonadota bacterium]